MRQVMRAGWIVLGMALCQNGFVADSDDQVVSGRVTFSPSGVAQGDVVELTIVLTIADRWFIDASAADWPGSALDLALPASLTRPGVWRIKKQKSANWSNKINAIEGELQLACDIVVGAGYVAAPFDVTVRYAACSTTICLPEQSLHLKGTLAARGKAQ
jgi:hypothetical protein